VTQPDTDGPASTTVVFFRAGVEVARTEVAGHVLELDLPKSIELRRAGSGAVHLIESPDPLYECCGQLPLPWVDRYGPHLSTLEVPPPFPFNGSDVATMWRARNRLVSKRRPPTSGEAEWSRLRVLVGDRVDWSALEAAVVTAGALLNAWPTRPAPAVTWLPVDRAGGRVLVGMTERAARSHRMPGAAPRTPAVTARRTSVPRDRTLHALTAVAALLGERILAVPVLAAEPDLRDRLAGLFRRVASRSDPDRPVADPPPSAWPSPMSGAYSTCVRALATVRDLGPGNQSAPLSELWELYEVWTAQTVLGAIESVLGPGGVTSGSRIGRWTDGSALIELHYQARIPASGSVEILGEKYSAAVGDLIPDLLLVRRDGGVNNALVLDAKKRSSEMASDDLTANASKYLWGIRRSDSPGTVPVLACAVMLAPLGGPAAGMAHGLADVYAAHPAAGIGPALVPELFKLLRSASGPHTGNAWHGPWA